MGNVLGMAGVTLGLGAMLVEAATHGATPTQFAEAAALLLGGGGVGWLLADKVARIPECLRSYIYLPPKLPRKGTQ